MYFSLAWFFGYILGRIGHYWINPAIGNPNWAPHHWIYGVLALLTGVFMSGFAALTLIGFGIGHIISDFDDLLAGRFIGSDDETQKLHFWGTD